MNRGGQENKNPRRNAGRAQRRGDIVPSMTRRPAQADDTCRQTSSAAESFVRELLDELGPFMGLRVPSFVRVTVGGPRALLAAYVEAQHGMARAAGRELDVREAERVARAKVKSSPPSPGGFLSRPGGIFIWAPTYERRPTTASKLRAMAHILVHESVHYLQAENRPFSPTKPYEDLATAVIEEGQADVATLDFLAAGRLASPVLDGALARQSRRMLWARSRAMRIVSRWLTTLRKRTDPAATSRCAELAASRSWTQIAARLFVQHLGVLLDTPVVDGRFAVEDQDEVRLHALGDAVQAFEPRLYARRICYVLGADLCRWMLGRGRTHLDLAKLSRPPRPILGLLEQMANEVDAPR